jgi:hypothetical protein
VVSSIGETSAKAEPDEIRSPPIQCSVETSTPSMTELALVAVLLSSTGRSFGSERYGRVLDAVKRAYSAGVL